MLETKKWRVALNVLIVLMTAAALLMMFFWRYGKLLDNGWQGFKYFTVLSNVFGGAASLIWLVFEAFDVQGRAARILALLKYAAAVCLGLTFTVVMIFLGPLYGYFSMFVSANFFFHLMTPFAAMLEFVLFNERKYGIKTSFTAMLPMAAYALFYLIYNLMMGRGEDPFRYDWYGFLLWGWPVGIGIAVAICLLTFGIAALLRFLNAKVNGEKGVEQSDT
jgi:hypothetical protein